MKLLKYVLPIVAIAQQDERTTELINGNSTETSDAVELAESSQGVGGEDLEDAYDYDYATDGIGEGFGIEARSRKKKDKKKNRTTAPPTTEYVTTTIETTTSTTTSTSTVPTTSVPTTPDSGDGFGGDQTTGADERTTTLTTASSIMTTTSTTTETTPTTAPTTTTQPENTATTTTEGTTLLPNTTRDAPTSVTGGMLGGEGGAQYGDSNGQQDGSQNGNENYGGFRPTTDEPTTGSANQTTTEPTTEPTTQPTTEPTTIEPTTTSYYPFSDNPYGPTKKPDNDQHSGLECWACDAPNFEECAKRGKKMTCSNTQESCMLEVRKRGTEYTQVCMGCKSTDACENQKASNFMGSRPNQFQCKVRANMDFEGPSVCRQCCSGKYCTGNQGGNGEFWIPETYKEWTEDRTKPNKNGKKKKPKKPKNN